MPIAKGAEEEDEGEEEELHREHLGTEATENAGDENWEKGAAGWMCVWDLRRVRRGRGEHRGVKGDGNRRENVDNGRLFMPLFERDKLARMLTEMEKFGFAVQSEITRYNGLFLSGTGRN
jgi:hypothetical protein